MEFPFPDMVKIAQMVVEFKVLMACYRRIVERFENLVHAFPHERFYEIDIGLDTVDVSIFVLQWTLLES